MHPYNLRPLARRLRLKRAKTFNEDNYQRQYYFTFPYPVTRHIFKNANAETQLKLRQTCKFFHKMNPMVIVEKLFFGRTRPRNAGKLDLYVQNFDEMPMIDVVTNGIHCDAFDTRMISKILRCEANYIDLCPGRELTMEEFVFFTESGFVKEWHGPNAYIRDKHGKVISLENILLHLPNAENVYAYVKDVKHENPSKIVSKNNKIKHLALEFHGPINVDHFYELLKNVLAPEAFLGIIFNDLTDETYVATFKAEMKEKMKTWTPHNEMLTLIIFTDHF